MPNRLNVFGNDNIRTPHLKCESCKTQVFFKGIKQSDGYEIRLFECPHCHQTTSLRIRIPGGMTDPLDEE